MELRYISSQSPVKRPHFLGADHRVISDLKFYIRRVTTPNSDRDKIVVFGLYKTGTTALYSCIRDSLSYEPRFLFEAAKYDCCRQDQKLGVLAKVILGDSTVDLKSFNLFEKKIILIRDPRNWIISACLFLTQQIQGIES